MAEKASQRGLAINRPISALPETVERMRAWEHSGFAVNSDRKIEAHLHAVVSLGLFRPDGVFLPMEDVDFSGLEEIFRERFFRMMLRREKVRPETVERMRAWEHSGFAVNSDRKIEAYDRNRMVEGRVW